MSNLIDTYNMKTNTRALEAAGQQTDLRGIIHIVLVTKHESSGNPYPNLPTIQSIRSIRFQRENNKAITRFQRQTKTFAALKPIDVCGLCNSG